MFAFCSARWEATRDCFSLVSIMMGVLGFGCFVLVGVVEKMFSICFLGFILLMGFGILIGRFL